MITDKKFPKCSALGILRRTNRGSLSISTQALHEALGWEALPGLLVEHEAFCGQHGLRDARLLREVAGDVEREAKEVIAGLSPADLSRRVEVWARNGKGTK